MAHPDAETKPSPMAAQLEGPIRAAFKNQVQAPVAWIPYHVKFHDSELAIKSARLIYEIAGETAAERIGHAEVIDNTARITPPDAQRLKPLAVLIDGKAFRIEGFDSEAEVISIAPTSSTLIFVEGADGTRLGDIEVYRDRRSFAFVGAVPKESETYRIRGELSHPGVLRDRDRVLSSASSPFWLPPLPEPFESLPVWVAAPGQVPTKLNPSAAQANVIRAQLGPGCQLTVELTHTRTPDNYYARLAYSDGASISFDAFEDSVLRIDGLPEGHTSLAILPVADGDGNPAAEAVVNLGPNAPVRSSFSLEATSSSLGHLSGEASFPDNWPSQLNIDNVYLSIVQMTRDDGTPIPHPKARIVRTTPLPSGVQRLRGWELGEVAPGEYRITLAPIGYLVDAFVHPGESTYRRIQCPELAQASIQFRRADSEEDEDVRVAYSYRLASSHGREYLLSPAALLRRNFDREGHYQAIGVPGKIWLTGNRATEGDFTVPIELSLDQEEFEVPLPSLLWIEVNFVQSSSDERAAWNWTGMVEAWSGDECLLPRSYITRLGQNSICVPALPSIQLRFVPEKDSLPIAAIQLSEHVPAAPSPGHIPHIAIGVSRDTGRVVVQAP